jgi:4-diphosphocytidyl-2-C-methyl-D-erythritol kinase
MSLSARVRAQGKINLLLRVLAREANGYHSIETLLHRIDLADDVLVRVTGGRSLDCAGPALPPGGLGPTEKNLAFRAATAYANETGWPDGFAIELVKNIPVGAGLGGGSADAGAVLRALDELSPAPLGHRLVELASGLGADVPFLTTDSPMALAWGRGERLLLVRPIDPRTILLVVPDFPIATADAYAWLAADRGDYVPTATVIGAEALATWAAIGARAVNDFEPIVARRHPRIGELVAIIQSMDPILAMLAGSGSGVFGIFDEYPDPAAVVRTPGATVIRTRTSDRIERVERDA